MSKSSTVNQMNSPPAINLMKWWHQPATILSLVGRRIEIQTFHSSAGLIVINYKIYPPTGYLQLDSSDSL